MTKFSRYQDYVIRDGRLVGDFETMYQDFADPWEQSTREHGATDKAIGIHWMRRLQASRVVELGCGLGHYTAEISAAGFEVVGVDISETAIRRASAAHPSLSFAVGDILDFELYRSFRPDVIVMSEITWYVLDKVPAFTQFLKAELPGIHLIHLLTTYPEGVQKYGRDKFTTLQGAMRYFDAPAYRESGEIRPADANGCTRTFFVATF